MLDKNKRRINYLRLSITDHCNLKCQYCLPEKNTSFYNSCDLLNSYEIEKIVKAFSLIGIKKVRITGGEPLVRKDFKEILEKIHRIEGIETIAITTNGFQLLENLDIFKENGLNRINISLDSLDQKKYNEITRGGDFNKIFDTIKEASHKNFERVRLNVVIMKDINDNEILDFVNLTKDLNIGVRFIEVMPIGEGKKFTSVKNSDILTFIEEHYPLEKNFNMSTDGPATYYKVPGFLGEIGFISPLSNSFCDSCNRVRVTSNGFLKLCLHYDKGIDLLPYLKNNTSIEALARIIEKAIYDEKPKEHHMNDNEYISNIESKEMNKIGG